MSHAKQATSSLLAVTSGMLLWVFAAGVAPGLSQSFGDIARRDRERRESQTRRVRVYTNEDLARPRILEPEGQPIAESPAPPQREPATQPEPETEAAEQLATKPFPFEWPAEVPLGDIARFYRNQSAGKAELAAADRPRRKIVASSRPSRKPLVASSRVPLRATTPPRKTPEPMWDPPKQAPEKIRVQRGDSLWKLAARHLGDGKQWRKIAAANAALSNPNLLRPGQELALPGNGLSSSSLRQVRVQAGDSLWRLAATQMGSGNAWSCIAAANPQIEDTNLIYPGQVIVIPARCSANS